MIAMRVRAWKNLFGLVAFLLLTSCYLNSNISGLTQLNSTSTPLQPVVTAPAEPKFKTLNLPMNVPEGYPYYGTLEMENTTGVVNYSLADSTCDGLTINSATGVTSGVLNHASSESCSYKIKASHEGKDYLSNLVTLNFSSPLAITFSKNYLAMYKGGGISTIQLNFSPPPPFDSFIDYELTNISGTSTSMVSGLSSSPTLLVHAGVPNVDISLNVPGGATLSTAEYKSLQIKNGTSAAKPNLDLLLSPGAQPNISMVASGAGHACSISGGKLYCWGTAAQAVLGNGTTTPAVQSPTQIGSMTNWQKISAGSSLSCGIESGRLFCWGDDAYGGQGNGATTGFVLTPTQVGALTTWQQISAGAYFACGIEGGRLWCWGRDLEGQVGNGSPASNMTSPAQVGALTTWQYVAAGESHACGIEGGRLWCWGSDSVGQIGSNAVTAASTTSPLQVGSLTTWQEVAVGTSHTCGIEGGRLWCWGSDSFGQLGNGSSSSSQTLPQQIGTDTDWQHISAKGTSTCGVKANSLYCWGQGGGGQLGDGTIALDAVEPKRVDMDTDWSAISVGNLFNCGLKANKLFCWGMDNYGQLGNGAGTGNSAKAPRLFSESTQWQSVAAGETNTCGIDNGKLFCMGDNDLGQVGINQKDTIVNAFTAVGLNTRWQKITAKNSHLCGITDGKLYCWGYNYYGQIGNNASGAGFDALVPTRIGSLTHWQEITTTTSSTCGIESGKLYCWGSDDDGRQGNGASTGNILVPTQIGSLTTWQKIAGGSKTVCGIAAGALYCWGSDTYAQIGNGTTTGNILAPAQIGSSTNWTAISAGKDFVCGIESGKLYCWGSGVYGQLGDAVNGPGYMVDAPKQIGSATNWQSVVLGGYTACATQSSGALYCWGYNYDGQAGVNSATQEILTPTQVGSSTHWQSVSIGMYHACGVESGKLYCWGDRNFFIKINNLFPRPVVEFQ